MKTPFDTGYADQSTGTATTRRSWPVFVGGLLVIGAVTFGAGQMQAAPLHSPRGQEQFDGGEPMAVAPIPLPKTIRLKWNFPASRVTPDLIFKVYHSTNPSSPVREWYVLTNLPGGHRAIELPADKPQEFFALTASNYLGESAFAGR